MMLAALLVSLLVPSPKCFTENILTQSYNTSVRPLFLKTRTMRLLDNMSRHGKVRNVDKELVRVPITREECEWRQEYLQHWPDCEMSKNYAIYAYMKMVYQRHTVLKDHLANQPPGRPGMLMILAMQSEKKKKKLI